MQQPAGSIIRFPTNVCRPYAYMLCPTVPKHVSTTNNDRRKDTVTASETHWLTLADARERAVRRNPSVSLSLCLGQLLPRDAACCVTHAASCLMCEGAAAAGPRVVVRLTTQHHLHCTGDCYPWLRFILPIHLLSIDSICSLVYGGLPTVQSAPNQCGLGQQSVRGGWFGYVTAYVRTSLGGLPHLFRQTTRERGDPSCTLTLFDFRTALLSWLSLMSV